MPSLSYPTPEEIMAERFLFKRGVLTITRQWKQKYFTQNWSKLQPYNKLFRIGELLLNIDRLYHSNPELYLRGLCVGPLCCYAADQKIIILSNPSIISALHELGHHIFGTDELTACRFSCTLFERVFPEQFKHLDWVGHCLVKRR